MSLAIRTRKKPRAEIQRLLREQVDAAIDALVSLDRERGVHAARKACKRGRAILRLAQSGLPAERYASLATQFRDAARWLAPIRDADVMQATARIAGVEPPPRFDEDEGLHRVMAARILLRELGQDLDADPVKPKKKHLIEGFTRGYAKARRQLDWVSREPEPENVHEWRKSVKHHFFHLQMMTDVFPGLFGGLAASADRLQETLGDHHDLSVLRPLLTDPRAVHGLRVREATLAEAAISAGRLQFSLHPDFLDAWLRHLWKLRTHAPVQVPRPAPLVLDAPAQSITSEETAG